MQFRIKEVESIQVMFLVLLPSPLHGARPAGCSVPCVCLCSEAPLPPCKISAAMFLLAASEVEKRVRARTMCHGGADVLSSTTLVSVD